MAESRTSPPSERAQRALAGQLPAEELTGPETRSFFSGLAESMLAPSDAERAFYASLGEDAPGTDEAELYGTSPGSDGLPPHQPAAAGPIGIVIAMAIDVWKSPGRAVTWLRHPHPLLDGRPPLPVAAVEEDGAQRVMNLLGRLQHGTAS